MLWKFNVFFMLLVVCLQCDIYYSSALVYPLSSISEKCEYSDHSFKIIVFIGLNQIENNEKYCHWLSFIKT